MLSDAPLNRHWIVAQLGAREHYAVARALGRNNLDYRLLTDYWASRWSSSKQAKQRRHAEIPRKNVVAFNAGLIQFEAKAKWKRWSSWQLIIQRNKWFSDHVTHWFQQQQYCFPSAPVVFSYSYTAEMLFRAAKAANCLTILGQIDPGPAESHLVARVHQDLGLPPFEEPPNSYWDAWRRECDLADVIIVNSDWSKQGLVSDGIQEEKIKIVPLVFESSPEHAVEQRHVPQSFDHNRPLEVLFLGQTIARKGLVELAAAAEILRDAPVRWTIVGGGEPAILERLKSAPNVRLVGKVSRFETQDYYRRSDVFLLPTHSDGFALTLLEAASHGLPIIASKNCGDVVDHDENGLILDLVTPEAIAETVNRYLSMPGLCQEHAARCAARQFQTLGDLERSLLEIAGEMERRRHGGSET